MRSDQSDYSERSEHRRATDEDSRICFKSLRDSIQIVTRELVLVDELGELINLSWAVREVIRGNEVVCLSATEGRIETEDATLVVVCIPVCGG